MPTAPSASAVPSSGAGLLLQHGSLLLDPPAELWSAVFGGPPPPLAPLPQAGGVLEALLRGSAESSLCGGGLQERPLEPEEWRQIEALEPL